MGDWGIDGWAVQPGTGQIIDMGGPNRPEVLVRGSDVANAMGVFVFRHAVIPENRPHAHLDFMKIAYILEGEYDFRVGDSEFSVGPGAVVVVPKGSFHAFTTATAGRMLFACSPSGNEELFVQMGRLGPDATAEQLSELNDRFHTVSLPGDEGPPWRGLFAAEPRQNIDASDDEGG